MAFSTWLVALQALHLSFAFIHSADALTQRDLQLRTQPKGPTMALWQSGDLNSVNHWTEPGPLSSYSDRCVFYRWLRCMVS